MQLMKTDKMLFLYGWELSVVILPGAAYIGYRQLQIHFYACNMQHLIQNINVNWTCRQTITGVMQIKGSYE